MQSVSKEDSLVLTKAAVDSLVLSRDESPGANRSARLAHRRGFTSCQYQGFFEDARELLRRCGGKKLSTCAGVRAEPPSQRECSINVEAEGTNHKQQLSLGGKIKASNSKASDVCWSSSALRRLPLTASIHPSVSRCCAVSQREG